VIAVDINCRVYSNGTWKKLNQTVALEDVFYEFNVFLPENGFTLFQILKISEEVEYHRSIYFLHINTVEEAKKQAKAFVESKEADW
jgi:hypothetical protein